MDSGLNGSFYNKYWGIAKVALNYGDGITQLTSLAFGSTNIWRDDLSETDWTLVEYTYLNGSAYPSSPEPTDGAYDELSKWHGYLSWGPYWLNRTFYINDDAPVGFKINYDITVSFDFVGVCDFDHNDALILFIDDEYAWEMDYTTVTTNGIIWQDDVSSWLIDCEEADNREVYLVLNVVSDTIRNVSGDKEFSISFFMQYSLEAADEAGLISNITITYTAASELVPCGCTDSPTHLNQRSRTQHTITHTIQRTIQHTIQPHCQLITLQQFIK